MAEQVRDVLPFLAAVLFILLGPLFVDDVSWKHNYRRFYRRHGTGLLTEANLTTSAEWVADMAQVFPGCVLAWVGAVLVLPTAGTGIALLSVGLTIIPLAAVNISGRRQALHKKRRVFGTPYTWTQLLVVAVNALSACFVWFATPPIE